MADVLTPYLSGKGTAKFPLDKPVPFDLVADLARHPAIANAERLAAKRRKAAK
jgi:uncharacterized protein YdhG (YjbR/CyaY superfamily)